MITFFPELILENRNMIMAVFKYYPNFMKKGKIKMGTLKNLPTESPEKLTSLITSKKNQIISMALSNSRHLQMSIYAFADKETVSEEKYFGDTMYLVIEGETQIKKGEKEYNLKTGDTFMVPAHTLHAIGGDTAFKLLQITLNEGGE